MSSKTLFKRLDAFESEIANAYQPAIGPEGSDTDTWMKSLLALADPSNGAPPSIRLKAIETLGHHFEAAMNANRPQGDKGGVMQVPTLAKADDWERTASQQQGELQSNAG